MINTKAIEQIEKALKNKQFGDEMKQKFKKKLEELRTKVSVVEEVQNKDVEKLDTGLDFEIIDKPTRKRQYELNVAIEDYLEDKTLDYKFTPDAKEWISQFSGYGGLAEFGPRAAGQGINYEFYTDDQVAKAMWGLALKHGYTGGQILEPSAGVGVFLKHTPAQAYLKEDATWTAFELNPVSAKILKILYPQAIVFNKRFESQFINKKNNTSYKNDVNPIYKLVIGNPPYGNWKSEERGMGEDFTKATTYDDYFITRGLDLLEKDGLLIYIIGAEARAGGKLWLQKDWSGAKPAIAMKSEIVDAYIMPSGIFERTGVISHIIVLRKTV